VTPVALALIRRPAAPVKVSFAFWPAARVTVTGEPPGVIERTGDTTPAAVRVTVVPSADARTSIVSDCGSVGVKEPV
jgi:hypothetical protein